MRAALIAVALASGCATTERPQPKQAPAAQLPAAQYPAADCRPALDKVDALNVQLQAEIAERQRIVRAAARREESLRKQLDALKAIERGILEREERMQTDRK